MDRMVASYVDCSAHKGVIAQRYSCGGVKEEREWFHDTRSRASFGQISKSIDCIKASLDIATQSRRWVPAIQGLSQKLTICIEQHASVYATLVACFTHHGRPKKSEDCLQCNTTLFAFVLGTNIRTNTVMQRMVKVIDNDPSARRTRSTILSDYINAKSKHNTARRHDISTNSQSEN